MASNFVVLYSGREGSTAIISSLSAQQNICVPVKEDLDGYCFRVHHPAAKIYKTLATIFETGIYDKVDPNGLFSTTQQFDSGVTSVGFKWRFFGDPQKVAKVFASHNVVVFQLSRRSFIDLACSNYVHTYAAKIQSDMNIGRHPQFEMNKLGKQDRQAYSDRLSNQEFALKTRLFF